MKSFTVSNTHALSAAHCGTNRVISNIGISVGEHDVKKDSDSPYSKLLRISQFLIHPSFDIETNAHDIAIVKISTPLTFTKGVQPACLPFQFKTTSFVSRNVHAVGW